MLFQLNKVIKDAEERADAAKLAASSGSKADKRMLAEIVAVHKNGTGRWFERWWEMGEGELGGELDDVGGVYIFSTL